MGKIKREIGQVWNPEKHHQLQDWLSSTSLAVEIIVQIDLCKGNQFTGEIKTELLWLSDCGTGRKMGWWVGAGGCKKGREWGEQWVSGEAPTLRVPILVIYCCVTEHSKV